MSDLLVTFLGTGRYEPVRYTYAGKTSANPEDSVPAALVELLQTTDLKVQPLLTAEVAGHENFRKFRDRLGNKLLPEQLIDAPQSEIALWAIFEKVVACVNEGDRVWFDVTHGFRALPIIALQALSFVRHVKKFRLEGLLYGAFEAKEGDVAPIFDLTAMLVLPEWGEALGEWRRTGRADGIVERTRPYLDKVKKELRESAPKSLVQLPQSLKTLSAALALVRSDKQADWAGRVLGNIEGARAALPAHPALAPLRLILDLIAADVEPLSHGGDEGSLRQQLRTAEWYMSRGRFVEAATTLREVLTSGAVAIAQAQGVATLPRRNGVEAAPHDAEYRAGADFALQVVSGHVPDGEPQQPASDAMRTVPEELLRSAKSALDTLRDLRNRLNHAWTSSEARRVKFVARDPLSCVQHDLKTSLSEVRAFVEGVEGPSGRHA
ncbi:MAG: TIGR02221 family CRISPR-associated protein [Planctomycetota bacterium]